MDIFDLKDGSSTAPNGSSTGYHTILSFPMPYFTCTWRQKHDNPCRTMSFHCPDIKGNGLPSASFGLRCENSKPRNIHNFNFSRGNPAAR